MTPTIEQIANRANALEGSLSHGKACFTACRELGVPENEVAATAGVVSALLANRPVRKVPGSLRPIIATLRRQLARVSNPQRRAKIEAEIAGLLKLDPAAKGPQ